MPNGSVNHVFTINNPFNTNKVYKPFCEWLSVCVYVRWAIEKGDNGTVHYQGYMLGHTGEKRTNKWLAKELGTCIDFQSMGGSVKDNDDYVCKVGKYVDKAHTHCLGPFEVGEKPRVGQGRRTDIEGACELIRSKRSREEVALQFPAVHVKHWRGLDDYRRTITPVPTTKPKVIVVYGASHTGKSWWAKQLGNWMQIPVSSEGWCDGYEDQEVIIWDEFEGQWDINLLKNFLQDRPRLKVKGSYVNNYAHTIVLTSNRNPRVWYRAASRINVSALFNRFDEVYEVNYDGLHPWKLNPSDRVFQAVWTKDSKEYHDERFWRFVE